VLEKSALAGRLQFEQAQFLSHSPCRLDITQMFWSAAMGNLIYSSVQIVLGLFVFIFLYATGYWLPVLIVLVVATVFGMAFGKEETGRFQAISKRPAGSTESARRLYESLSNRMSYRQVALRAGTPGKLVSESSNRFCTQSSYEWRDSSGACASALFEDDRLIYFSFYP
jgi:hypothetical protein